ncbi:facilitated trehalose transporter Tret1 isoform X2 [Eurytemora carolleeae]|uniref:facilitated trehalose transporter Tret1 isoform X2 n=1 Tax=Eurytemora carolleeae TaxID=1294199 RepID=UPI000C76E4D4|nr:facilitated trehalose transporter Tret1 isoform X2 [Eurytemora carolleeae]|eukprot:XP_023329395.1 facilitated trehalose transporter Tret1-like isoform X2 [Eurytemora affinis]
MTISESDLSVDMKTRRSGSSFRMVLAGIICTLPGISSGLSMGFSAVLIPQLQEQGADIQISLEEGSWIASLFVVGDLLGCVIGGPIADRFGRRNCILLNSIPLSLGWILIQQSQTLLHLYISREISSADKRGLISILLPASANIGFLLMYVLGYFIPYWRSTTLPGILLPLVPWLAVYFLPETPVWLIKNLRRSEAAVNLAKLRGLTIEDVQAELNSLEQPSVPSESFEKESGKSKLSLITNRTSILPMLLLIFLFFTQSFSGSNMVSYYTVTILQMAKIPIDESIASILVAAQFVIGYCCSASLIRRFPMRTLLMCSLFIMGMANLATSLVLMRNQRDCFMNLASASNGYPAQLGQSADQNFSSSQSNTSQLIFSQSDNQDFSSSQSNTNQLAFNQSDDQDSSSQSNTNQLTFNQSDDQVSSSQSNTNQLTFNQSDDQDSSSQSNTSQLIFSKSENDNMSTSQQVNIQTEADHVYSFIPVISCIFICFGYGIGLGPIPFILFGELFPSEVRGIMSSITAFLRSITVFVSIKIFPMFLRYFGIGGSFLTCSLVCFSALGISFFTVPETKGLTSSELENIYKKQKTPALPEKISV